MPMMHIQLSVDARRWPDKMLDGILTDDTGRHLSATEARAELANLAAAGYEVVPCGRCTCDDKGRCSGDGIATR